VYPSPPADDPIRGIFDLSDRAANAAPRLRGISRAATILLLATLAIVGYLLFTGLLGNLVSVTLGVVALAGGGAALLLLRENERYYEEYVERHRTLLRLQEADPAPPIPEGHGPAERLLAHLAASNPRVADALAADPRAARFRVQAHVGGSTRRFDLLLLAHGRSRLGKGTAGFALVGRVAPGGIGPETVAAFVEDVNAIAPRLREPLVRAILLTPNGGSIAESAYAAAKRRPVALGPRTVPVELVAERTDGTYDLVPLLVDAP
jgi:hypothetical protein